MPVDTSLQAKLLADIGARHAKRKMEGMLHQGNEAPSVERIPFDSPQLNFATGGGVPRGRWTRFYGGKSSGKSLTAWHVIKNAQRMGLSCVYYNIEGQYDPEYTARTGVDIDKLLVVQGAVIEDIGENLETLLGGYHVHVLDSASEASSLQELNAEYGDSLYATEVRAWKQVFKKVVPHFDLHENSIIYLDQVRDSFTAGGGVHPPGGRLMEHRSSLTLYFKMLGWCFTNDAGRLDTEGSGGASMTGRIEPDGIEVNVVVEKNRVGRPFRQALMHYHLDDARIDWAWELANAALYLDVDGVPAHKTGKPTIIQKTGEKSSFYLLPDGETKVQGRHQLAVRIEEDDEVRKYVEGCLQRGW